MHMYHRWCLFTIAGALMARRVYLKHGHFNIFPNIYVMLIGEPGARKSSAIKLAGKLLKATGYTHFAATKTSKERFLLDFEGVDPSEYEAPRGRGRAAKSTDIADYDTLAENIFGAGAATREPRECFVCADEFNEFIGIRNTDFVSLLGSLWDWDDETTPFESRIKNGRSAKIFQPTCSILGGNTHENFNTAFPPEILGQGFFSRLLLIYGERSDRRLTIPPTPPEAETAALVQQLAGLQTLAGEATISESAFVILDQLYKGWQDIPDTRFSKYSNRRFTHLLKLCLIVAGLGNVRTSTGGLEVSESVVRAANTYLTAAEILMPKALGEFGKSRNSSVINAITEILRVKDAPMKAHDIWKEVRRDLNKLTELVDILTGMVSAGVIFHISQRGYMLKGVEKKTYQHVDWSLLTEEEQLFIAR